LFDGDKCREFLNEFEPVGVYEVDV